MGKLMDALTYPGYTVEETAAIIEGERKMADAHLAMIAEPKPAKHGLKPKFEFCGDYGYAKDEVDELFERKEEEHRMEIDQFGLELAIRDREIRVLNRQKWYARYLHARSERKYWEVMDREKVGLGCHYRVNHRASEKDGTKRERTDVWAKIWKKVEKKLKKKADSYLPEVAG